MRGSCKNADMQTNAIRAILCGAALLATGCSASTPPPAAAPTLAQLPDVDMSAVLAHTKVLSSDEYGGRAPGYEG